MTDAPPPGARLLFVLDNDFGALGMVMYLLHGQSLAARATLLLPRRAYELHRGQLAAASHSYDSLADILAVCAANPPDVVFLVSGYLLVRQGLLSIGELRELVRALQARGCTVATSDPYLGTFPRIAEATVPVRTGAIPRALKRYLGHAPFIHRPLARLVDHVAQVRFTRHVRAVTAALADLPHLYPALISMAEAGGVRPYCFYNPNYFRAPEPVQAVPGERPAWLFVIAQYDLHYQEERHGRERFAELVAARIREALAQGRDATFVGPATMVEALSARFPREPGVTLLGRCAFGDFERRLLHAEVAFYWQVFSTSAFLRLWNGLPVFSFDAGHTSHFSGALFQAGLRHYFMGEAPRYLDIEVPLDAAALARLEDAFRRSARNALARFKALSEPEEMVAAIRARTE